MLWMKILLLLELQEHRTRRRAPYPVTVLEQLGLMSMMMSQSRGLRHGRRPRRRRHHGVLWLRGLVPWNRQWTVSRRQQLLACPESMSSPQTSRK